MVVSSSLTTPKLLSASNHLDMGGNDTFVMQRTPLASGDGTAFVLAGQSAPGVGGDLTFRPGAGSTLNGELKVVSGDDSLIASLGDTAIHLFQNLLFGSSEAEEIQFERIAAIGVAGNTSFVGQSTNGSGMSGGDLFISGGSSAADGMRGGHVTIDAGNDENGVTGGSNFGDVLVGVNSGNVRVGRAGFPTSMQGEVEIAGDTSITGDVILGDSVDDTITITGRIAIGPMRVQQCLVPTQARPGVPHC
jgi:hypothetical protein